ncbi:MAG: hypothetical protein HOB27_00105 [Candidatus Marinimicrobia bacterium]|nr:hypothetical protein [Candidatus Neomarinimicrobiota bacterium]
MRFIKSLLSILFIIGILSGEAIEKKEERTYFFGLIKLGKKQKHEKGYWADKLFHGREFHAPVTFIPIEIRYGLGFNGELGGTVQNPTANVLGSSKWLRLEEGVSSFNPSITEMTGTSMEVDLALYNLADKYFKSNWLDMLTGFTYRSSTLLIPAEIPYADWGVINASWGSKRKFSPKVNEYLLTTHMLWQSFDSWFIDFRYSYGLARAKFYSKDNVIFDGSPSGTGTSMGLSVGLRYIIDSKKINRFTVGIDFRHSYTKINSISDESELTPITRFDLANYGIYLSLSAFYGGQKTIGDQGKTHYYNRNFMRARKDLRKFVAQFPHHANRYRAEAYLQKCDYKIPYEIMIEGIQLDDENKVEAALDRYLYALQMVVDDSVIVNTLNHRITQIAGSWMNHAELLLRNKAYTDAYHLTKKVAKFSDLGKTELARFHSYSVLDKGKKYQKYGFISRAMSYYTEALSLNNDLAYEVRSLQYQAGITLVEIANKVDKFDEIQLAIQSLEKAKALAKDIGSKNEKLLDDLKKKMNELDTHKSKTRIAQKMETARAHQILARSPRLVVGLTVPQVQVLLGEPADIIQGKIENEGEQLWIYYLKENQVLQLSFRDFRLFKIEEKY